MRSPLEGNYGWDERDEVLSTQSIAAEHVRNGSGVGIVFAHEQTAGRGRLGRTWLSSQGDSLTASFIFWPYADHAQPYLVAMSMALAVADAVHCQVRWPNDLTFGKKKLGGILTELFPDPQGRMVPVVGLGLNLNQAAFPAEIDEFATSLYLQNGDRYEPEGLVSQILRRIELLPEPTSWSDLAPIWSTFDQTPGKKYKLASGEEAVALGVGSEGQLLCSVDGEPRSVLAAEAWFGIAD